jgi:hypothetical protein
MLRHRIIRCLPFLPILLCLPACGESARQQTYPEDPLFVLRKPAESKGPAAAGKRNPSRKAPGLSPPPVPGLVAAARRLSQEEPVAPAPPTLLPVRAERVP